MVETILRDSLRRTRERKEELDDPDKRVRLTKRSRSRESFASSFLPPSFANSKEERKKERNSDTYCGGKDEGMGGEGRRVHSRRRCIPVTSQPRFSSAFRHRVTLRFSNLDSRETPLLVPDLDKRVRRAFVRTRVLVY